MISKYIPLITLIFGINCCGIASAKSTEFTVQNHADVTEVAANQKGPLVLQDSADAEMELICPDNCTVVSVENHHGEINSFCDCNNDGKRDKACQIWLKDFPNGGQQTYCQQRGCDKGEQCVKETKEFPSGDIQQACVCDAPFCDDINKR